ncbi:MAG: ATP-binding protein [Oscillochloridaceae bacterium]|nr:ATP-binding protein [Chloroflexaceae bacterium]MDW8390210.1 ATP-binding protein [Oscillochloridaceae bacterium]
MSYHSGHALVIDSDPVTREVCATTLRDAGFVVHALDAPAAARDALLNAAFDLVLLDGAAPGGDGLALLRQLHEQQVRVPVLLMCGDASVEFVTQAMRLGARGLLVKPFSADDLRATALEIAGERRAARSRDRVAALRPAVRIGQRLLGELDLQRLQDLIIETVRTELEADRASLMLFEDDGQWLRIVACSGLPAQVRVGHRVAAERSLAGWVAMRRQPVRLDFSGDVALPVDELRGVFLTEEIGSALSVPVLAGEQVLGVLNAAKTHARQPFTEDDQELLMLLAAQAAVAIENARLYTRVASSEGRYRALLQHASDAVLLVDASGRAILDANLALEHLSGYSHAELLAMPLDRLLPALAQLIQRTVEGYTGGAVREGAEIEMDLYTRQEQTTPVAVSLSAVSHAGERLILVIARDVSERQRIAKQLVQAEKLAALGRLSASLAHEINNPLQAIHNSVYLLLTRPLAEEKRQRYLQMTLEEIERLISIVQRMLDFYRPNREGMRPVDVDEILDAVLTLTETQMAEQGVRLIRQRAGRLPRIFAISNHLKQVCFNLIFNALEAMPDGGELYVKTALLEEGATLDREGFVTVLAGGSAEGVERARVVIEISDTGSGIPNHDLPKIFEPFFTTRTKGTGLGLAVSYSIIEQHHGDLAVRSVVGEGTTFRVALPVAQ